MKSVAYLMEQCTLKWKGIESFYCITIPSAGPSDKHALACFEIVVQVPFRVPFRVPFPRRGIRNRIRNRIHRPKGQEFDITWQLGLCPSSPTYSIIPKRGGMDVVPNMDVVPIINVKRNFSKATNRSNGPSGDKFKNSLVYLAHPQLDMICMSMS
jgi:hypothetical protein